MNAQRLEVQISSKYQLPRRTRILIMTMLTSCVAFMIRIGFRIAIVKMSESKRVELENGTVFIKPADLKSNSVQFRLAILSPYFGQICSHVFAGYMSCQFGGHTVLGLSQGIMSVLVVIVPVLTNISVYYLLVLHFIVGIFEGAVQPSIMNILARWFPSSEKSAALTISASGKHLGLVLGTSWSAFLEENFGWECILYVSGLIGMVWTLLWFAFTKRYPTEDSCISENELQKIIEDRSLLNIFNNVKPPWKSILTSIPLWAASLNHFSSSWCYYTLVFSLPMFFKDVFDFNVSKAGVISVLPYYTTFIVTLMSGYLADKMISMHILDATNTRKLFSGCAYLLDAMYIFSLASWKNVESMMVCLVFASGIQGLAYASFPVNHLDMAPQYAPVTFGVSCMMSTISGITSSLVVLAIVVNHTIEEWRYVFYLSAGISCIGTFSYLLFSSGERQPWASTIQ